MIGFLMDTVRNEDGTLTTNLYYKGKKVGSIENHNFPGDILEASARQFREDNPHLFTDAVFLPTAAESKRKNPELFGDEGKLSSVPGH